MPTSGRVRRCRDQAVWVGPRAGPGQPGAPGGCLVNRL